MLRNQVQAEDVVIEAVFWIFGKTICSKVFIPHCVLLFKSVYFKCLNEIKHNKVRDKFELHHLNHSTLQTRMNERTELRNSIEDAINALPAECKRSLNCTKIRDLNTTKLHDQISPKTV